MLYPNWEIVMNENPITASNPYKIEIVPYNKHWVDLFKDEANRIQKALGECLKEIYHIGSTWCCGDFRLIHVDTSINFFRELPWHNH